MSQSASLHRRLLLICLLPVLAFVFGSAAFAADTAPGPETVAQLTPAPTVTGSLPINSGDNAWLLASSALVLMMTAPGLILFYGGLVRSKNVLSTMMHSLILMAVMSALWMVFGYSMAFGEGNAFFGNPFTHFFLQGRGRRAEPGLRGHGAAADVHAVPDDVRHHHAGADQRRGGGTHQVQGVSAVHACCGSTVVYFPLCHMVWGKGGLFNWALGGKIPVLDFAGGTVVHISSGVSALVCALVLGKRDGYPARTDDAAQRRAVR